jgi:hypothetical protein
MEQMTQIWQRLSWHRLSFSLSNDVKLGAGRQTYFVAFSNPFTTGQTSGMQASTGDHAPSGMTGN